LSISAAADRIRAVHDDDRADKGANDESPVARALTRSEETKDAVSHPLSDDPVELIAERFRELSEPISIKLLDRRREGEATVVALTEVIGTT